MRSVRWWEFLRGGHLLRSAVVLLGCLLLGGGNALSQQAPPAAQQAYAAALREALRNRMPFARAKQYASQIGEQVWMDEVNAGRAVPPGAYNNRQQPQPRPQAPQRPMRARTGPARGPAVGKSSPAGTVGDLSLAELTTLCDQVRSRVRPPAPSEDQELAVAGSVMDSASNVPGYEAAEQYWENSIKPAVLSGDSKVIADVMRSMPRSHLSALISMLESSRWGELPAVVDDRSASQWLLQCLEALAETRTSRSTGTRLPADATPLVNSVDRAELDKPKGTSLPDVAMLAAALVDLPNPVRLDAQDLPPARDSWKPDHQKAEAIMKEVFTLRESGGHRRALELLRDAFSHDDRLDPAEAPRYFIVRAAILKELGDASAGEAFKDYSKAQDLDDAGSVSEAVECYCEAVIHDPHFPWSANNLAWLRSTNAAATQKDGLEAIPFAMYACVVTQWHYWGFIDTLAACYARSGDFATAIRCCDRAIELAPERERPQLLVQREKYTAGEPYTVVPNANPDLIVESGNTAVAAPRNSEPASHARDAHVGFVPGRYEETSLRQVVNDPSDFIGKRLKFKDLVVNPDIRRDRERDLGVFMFVGGQGAVTKAIVMKGELAIVASTDLCKRLDEPLMRSRQDLYREASLAASAGAIGSQAPDPSQEHRGPAGVSALYVSVAETPDGAILAMIDAIEVYSPFPRPTGTRTLLQP